MSLFKAYKLSCLHRLIIAQFTILYVTVRKPAAAWTLDTQCDCILHRYIAPHTYCQILNQPATFTLPLPNVEIENCWEMLHFHSVVSEQLGLLRWDTLPVGENCPMFRKNVVPFFFSKNSPLFLGCWSMKAEAVYSFELSVNTEPMTQCRKSRDLNLTEGMSAWQLNMWLNQYITS
jgi:hypothetical protein